jgi:hypothetical protein
VVSSFVWCQRLGYLTCLINKTHDMRKCFKYVLLVLLVLSSRTVSMAQVFTAAELTYDWVSDSTFQFILTLYSECDSNYVLPSSANICYFNSCNSFSGSLPLLLLVQPGPSNKYMYGGSFTLPSQCDYWTFHATVDRHPSVNLPGPNGIYVEATLNNLDGPTSSSSKLTYDPAPYLCINNPTYLLAAPIDPNNDSMVVERMQHYTSPGSVFSSCSGTPSLIPYSAPYTFAAPFSASGGNPMVLNPVTGAFSFTLTASALGYNNYALRLNKYRKSDGKKLGSVMRDAQFDAITCSAAPPNIAYVPNSFSGCQLNGSNILAYAGSSFSFCFYGAQSLAAMNHSMSMSDNTAMVLPGATVTYNVINADSIVGCFSFTPSTADTGSTAVIFTVQDSLINGSACAGQPVVLKSYLVAFIKILDPTAVDETEIERNIRVYPNPAYDVIRIQSPIPLNISVLSVDGKVVISKATDEEIDISYLCSGVYLIEMKDQKGRVVKMDKFIKGK